MQVQNVIIKELDSYYKIIENNQNTLEELEVQKKGKFELLLDLCKNKKETKLGEIAEIKTGKNKPSDGVGTDKKYPYYRTGGITGYTNEYLVDGDYILTPRNGFIGNITLCSGKSFPSDHMYIIKPYDNINIKYINYSLLGNNLSFYKTGSTIPNITKEILEESKIQIPSLEDQEKIIKSMEYFDELKKMYQTHIINTELQIKERFEFHLNKCKKSDETVPESKEELSDDEESDDEESEEEEKSIQVKKSSKTKKSKNVKCKM